MGATDEQHLQKRDSKRRRKRKANELVYWRNLNGELILALIDAIDQFGGAIRFGRNRAGTAYAIGIYGDGDSYTEYHEGTQGAVEWIEEITTDYSE